MFSNRTYDIHVKKFSYRFRYFINDYDLIFWVNKQLHVFNLDEVDEEIRSELIKNSNYLILLAWMLNAYDELKDEYFYLELLKVNEKDNIFTL
jgi:hypothetical protein